MHYRIFIVDRLIVLIIRIKTGMIHVWVLIHHHIMERVNVIVDTLLILEVSVDVLLGPKMLPLVRLVVKC
jgi:hypothetical protein